MTQAVKGFSIVSEAEVDVLELPCFLHDPKPFSKPSLYIWKFLVHVLLKPSLKDFGYYFASMWNECNCTVVWTVFGIAFLWDCNENFSNPVATAEFSKLMAALIEL